MAEMTAPRRRMIEDMQVRNLSPVTQRCYVHAVAKFARHFNRSPDRLRLEKKSGLTELPVPYRKKSSVPLPISRLVSLHFHGISCLSAAVIRHTILTGRG